MYVRGRFRGKWAEALLCHGWMNFYPIPPTGSVPSPSLACSPTAQPLKLFLTFILTLTAQYLQKKKITLVSGLGAPLPRDPAKCLEQTCQGQWGCISKAPIPRLSGKDSLQPYAKLNKLGNSLCPWEPLSWTSPPPGCDMHPANGQPVCQILLVLSLTQANS